MCDCQELESWSTESHITQHHNIKAFEPTQSIFLLIKTLVCLPLWCSLVLFSSFCTNVQNALHFCSATALFFDSVCTLCLTRVHLEVGQLVHTRAQLSVIPLHWRRKDTRLWRTKCWFLCEMVLVWFQKISWFICSEKGIGLQPECRTWTWHAVCFVLHYVCRNLLNWAVRCFQCFLP